jgi:peptidyl-prolyl cis-trans isomerase B (cyclophilin B)
VPEAPQPPTTTSAPPYPPSYVYPSTPYGYYASPPTNTLAIVSFILAFVVAPAGFVLAIVALRQIARSGEGGRGLAVAGLVVSAVVLFIFVVYVVLLVSFIAFIGG